MSNPFDPIDGIMRERELAKQRVARVEAEVVLATRERDVFIRERDEAYQLICDALVILGFDTNPAAQLVEMGHVEFLKMARANFEQISAVRKVKTEPENIFERAPEHVPNMPSGLQRPLRNGSLCSRCGLLLTGDAVRLMRTSPGPYQGDTATVHPRCRNGYDPAHWTEQ